MELDVFLEEYGRLLKEDSEKVPSLSAVASVYVKLASELLQSGNQNEVPFGRGYVYLLCAVGIDLYKIGSSEDDLDAVSRQEVLVLEFMNSTNPYEEKRRIQSMFQANQVTNEWFNFSKEELLLVRQQFT